jgi:hypothetical protein
MRRVRDWDEAYLLGLPVQEYNDIEFKASQTLDISTADAKNKTRVAIATEICALANSGGGKLVLGMKDPKDCKHGVLEVVDGGVIKQSGLTDTAEWLNAAIPNLVDFELNGFDVHPVEGGGVGSSITSGKAVYVIDIPDSDLAPHQCCHDRKYYVRMGGNSHPANHRTVLDIMGRQKHPSLELEFEIEVERIERNTDFGAIPIPITHYGASGFSNTPDRPLVTLCITARNVGRVLAQYVNLELFVPTICFDEDNVETYNSKVVTMNELKFYVFSFANTRSNYSATGAVTNSWFDPILPTRTHVWHIFIRSNWLQWRRNASANRPLCWAAYADSAPPAKGEVSLKDVPFIDKRKAK